MFSQFNSVGLIGSATVNGWDSDIDMMQNDTNPDLWHLNITLTDGAVKFRADDAWDDNWGSTDFPTGIGVQGGPDIPVLAGEYDITFNSATGEYHFEVMSVIGIIGDATAKGWDEDTNMWEDQDDSTKFFITLPLTMGEVKFRKDDEWAVNWGAADFPSGTAVQNGPNIPVSEAGDYYVLFDTLTGEYSFEKVITFESIGIIGDATPGLWDDDTDLNQSASDPAVWTVTLELTDGEAKFRANDDWAINWGGEGFPTDTASLDGPNIPVTAGEYLISFNTESLIYNFLKIEDFESMGIIGDATPGGWTDDTDMNQDPEDKSQWNLRIVLTDGEAKFRANDAWDFNWGSGDFPTGVGELDGANIPVTAGEYVIDFNSTTGEYQFNEIIVFDTVGVIGTGTEFGNWEDDVFLDKDPDNEFHFSSIVNLVDGEVKFRANAAWDDNWGGEDWPEGIGTQDGPNIFSVAGTYKASIYTDTGAYAFSDPLSTVDILDPAYVNIYPNPASDILNFELSSEEFSGRIHLKVIDLSGRKLISQYRSFSELMQIDISNLPTGTYFIQINSEKHLIGKKFSVVK